MEKVYKKVLVTATMSAGKSTLVNALIGKKLMTTQNESCTAKQYRIREDRKCEKKIYCMHNNMRINLKKNITQVLHNVDSDRVVIHSKMNHIHDKILWEVIDTPGVNSSADPEHKKITEDLICKEHFDILLYVMNGNHLGSNDDMNHLNFIKDKVPVEKIIFVINKVDQFRKNHDSIGKSVDNVKIQLENLGFKDPIIQPISAYTGYLLKLINSGYSLNEEETDELELLIKKLSRPTFDLSRYNTTDVQIGNNSKNKYNNELDKCGLYNLEVLICRKGVKRG